MKNKVITHILALLLLCCAASSCGSTSNAMKSGDPDLIYEYAMELYNAERWQKAASTFSAIMSFFDGTTDEDKINFYYARCLFKNRDYALAADELDYFRRTFGRSEFIEDAEGMYVLCYYYQTSDASRDQSTTSRTLLIIDEYLSRYPNSPQADTFKEIRAELMGRLYDKDYINAFTYYKIGRYKSAIFAFKNALKRYPESPRREELLFYTVASGYELAKNSITSIQADRFLTMLDTYYTFVAEFPESEFMPEVERMAKDTKKFLERRNAAQGDESVVFEASDEKKTRRKKSKDNID
ncbi:MAG: outer membrane protein assembly factor BamD [Rikenellaceae bacterium]